MEGDGFTEDVVGGRTGLCTAGSGDSISPLPNEKLGSLRAEGSVEASATTVEAMNLTHSGLE